MSTIAGIVEMIFDSLGKIELTGPKARLMLCWLVLIGRCPSAGWVHAWPNPDPQFRI